MDAHTQNRFNIFLFFLFNNEKDTNISWLFFSLNLNYRARRAVSWGSGHTKKGLSHSLSLFLIPLFLLEHSCQSCELFLFLEFSISCCSGSLMTPEKKCLYESFKRKKNDRPSKWSRFSQKHFSRQLSRGVFQWSVFFFLSLSLCPQIFTHIQHTRLRIPSLSL